MGSQLKLENLNSVFKKAKELKAKTLSVEVISAKLNQDEMDNLPKSFSSAVWLYKGEDLGDLKNTEPFVSLKKLSLRNQHLLFHVPCRNLKENDVIEILNVLKELNIRNVLVLQGEIVAERDKRDFEHAIDLVKYIKKHHGGYFNIGVAGYPDGHPEAVNANVDILRLKEKVVAGSDFVITQMFFDYNVFDNFYRKFKMICPDTPLLVGVYIISSFESFSLLDRLLKKDLPEDVVDFVTKNKDDQKAILEFGIQLCVDLIKKVLTNADSQIVGIHFFSWNKFDLVQRVCDILGFYEVHKETPPNMVPYGFYAIRENSC